MKVVFVLPNLAAGGAERVVTLLSREMVSRGTAVDIFLMLNGIVKYDVPDGVNVINMDGQLLTRFKRIRQMRAYFKQEQQKNKSVVVIPFHDSCLNHALAAAVGLSIPVIACERNNPYVKGNSRRARLKANLPYKLASHCVFQTPEAQDYFWPSIQRKSSIIFNPLQIASSIRWSGFEGRRIVSVGRLEPQKNQAMLIEAFAQVHAHSPGYTLDIYGEGTLRGKLQELICSLGLENVVFLRGYSSRIHEELAQASLFVLSSDYEGMSNALIEALAIGTPVVSTDHPIGGARAVIRNGENGILTPVGDSSALAVAIMELLKDPERAERMSERAGKIRDDLDSRKITKDWLDMIFRLGENNGTP